LFSSARAKADFHVDGYMVILGESMTAETVRSIAYWYSLWSHQRETYTWKGFVQIDLTPDADKSTEEILKMKKEELSHEPL
jgi:hypothetical protein